MPASRLAVSGLVLATVLCVTTNAFAEGIFLTAAMTGDGDCGVSSDKIYTHAYNIWGNTLTINGVEFTGTGTEFFNPSGENFSTSGFTYGRTNKSHNNVTGSVGDAMGVLILGGQTEVVTLTDLVVGQAYETVFYNAGWGDTGGRPLNITTSDGGVFAADENMCGDGNGNMFKYQFTAENTSLSFTFVEINSNSTFHLYAFSNELTTIPEPSTFAGLLTLLPAGLIAWRRKRG